MFDNLSKSIENLNLKTINPERKLILQPLIDVIQEKVNSNDFVNLSFICTHNSRRSLLSQVWAQAMAYYYKLPRVNCYSGGTEVTALFSKVANTLENQGFQIIKLSSEKNPIYSIKYSKNEPAIIGFSKKYDAHFNPTNHFIAILTCSQADEGCPYISGAAKRISINYDDPKLFDESELQTQKYLERSIEIATEMNYVFSQISF